MKRNAGSDLNHDNWDKEEEKEERGEFVPADKTIISQRKVIVARRKPTSGVSGVFKSFSGFSQNSSSSLHTDPKFNNDTTSFSNKEKHLNALKALNQKFLECISKHINENPFCVLTPTIDDYRNHLSIIKSKYPLSCASEKPSTTDDKPLNESQVNSTNSDASQFKPGMLFNLNAQPAFSFGSTKNESKPFSIPTFSELPTKSLFGSDTPKTTLFGNNLSSNKVETSTFSFSANKEADKKIGFSFPSVSTSNESNFSKNGAISLFTPVETPKGEEEEDYVPPVAEVRDVKEKDSVYDTKCKLYYRKNNEWKERGVGNLFIKPISNGKFQLVIRADNSLATIILNVLIIDSTTMTTNKNNVSLVAITDFDGEKNSPTSLLIRVKTSEKAEELLAAMKKQLN